MDWAAATRENSRGRCKPSYYSSKAGHFMRENVHNAMMLMIGSSIKKDQKGFRPVRLAILKHGIIKRIATIIEGRKLIALSMFFTLNDGHMTIAQMNTFVLCVLPAPHTIE